MEEGASCSWGLEEVERKDSKTKVADLSRAQRVLYSSGLITRLTNVQQLAEIECSWLMNEPCRGADAIPFFRLLVPFRRYRT